MDRSSKKKISPKEHIAAIFEDYEASARVLETLTNLSNTVIETALSGQCKFLFEILQNADDAFDDSSKYKDIKLQLVLLDNYLIIQHNGKVFDYYDVERICDYASQIEEVKANDLSKTGYKGLGFKSLFNLSDCIYVHSNGYSFRFDKSYWPDPKKKPWHVIPIWCDSLPLSKSYPYDKPVNFIMKITDTKQLKVQLNELLNHPEDLLYLHRVNSVDLHQNGMRNILERKVEKFGLFHKIIFLKNQQVVSIWLSRTYEKAISPQLKKCVREVSKFIFPDKIKSAEEIDLTFALCIDQKAEKPVKIDGFCYSTLPTQLQLSFPYHINSLFILNLDRTQFHENEWNEFLICQIGYLQLSFLKDLAELPNLKNFVIELLIRKINHPYSVFNKAFSKGFEEAKKQIAWLPAYKGCLLKLGEACIDKINFFKQNFQNIQDKQCEYVIDYDVKSQNSLNENEAKSFDYVTLFEQFPQKYYPQLTESSYVKFLSYIYEMSQKYPLGSSVQKLSKMPFLKTRNGTLISPDRALLEEKGNPIPDFAGLNPVDNEYLPKTNGDSFKYWLVTLGAKQLGTPIQILRESIFQWINSGTLQHKMNINNHKAVISYLAKNFMHFTYAETQTLKKKLIILTESNKFQIAASCYLPNAITLEELGKIMSSDKIISSSYDLKSLKDFFLFLEIPNSLSPFEVFRKCILVWIKNGTLKSKLTRNNYKPIIEFLSIEYLKIEYLLTKEEKETLKKLPILTSTLKFQEARSCYFDIAVPNITGFEDVIEKDKLVSTKNLTDAVQKFLLCIGVKEKIDPEDVCRNSILKWIKNGTVQSRINLQNHHAVLKYFAELWDFLIVVLSESEKKMLRKLPILTKSNNFREVSSCYWQTTGIYGSVEKIPKLESIVSADELVSSVYYANEKERSLRIEKFLNNLGVRYLNFVDICNRYCDHLRDSECIQWFFSYLIKHWEISSNVNGDKLLTDLKVKLSSSHILATNGKLYPITELYSSDFLIMHNIDKNAVPLLAFECLPKKLEKWLGIKQELDLACLVKLLEAVDKKEHLGEKITLNFFEIVLDQLRLKDKNEIRKYPLKLLSNENILTLAKDLYYFKDEGVICLANSYYLKRIHGMSHDNTLELAELCGVNVLSFSQDVMYEEQTPTFDKHLKDFYLERLPLIVLQESKKLYEQPKTVLQNLFFKINSLELHTCRTIFIKYSFGKPVKRAYFFDHLKIFVTKKWTNFKTKIHKHMRKILELKSDITDILDLESVCDEKAEFLDSQKDAQNLLMIEKELKKLISDDVATNKHDFVDDSSDNELHLQIKNVTKGKRTPKKHKNRARKSGTPKSYSLQTDFDVEPDKMLHNVTYGESYLKRLSEKYVFIFLQDYYKNKYPDAQIKSERAHFTLQRQSYTTEITWLNENVDKGLKYDLMLMKNKEIKQYINVKSVKQANNDLINLVHLGVKSSKFAAEQGDRNAKYCIYYILYENNSATSVPEEMNVNAVYKFVPLKTPSV